jgi:hypothetical protein
MARPRHRHRPLPNLGPPLTPTRSRNRSHRGQRTTPAPTHAARLPQTVARVTRGEAADQDHALHAAARGNPHLRVQLCARRRMGQLAGMPIAGAAARPEADPGGDAVVRPKPAGRHDSSCARPAAAAASRWPGWLRVRARRSRRLPTSSSPGFRAWPCACAARGCRSRPSSVVLTEGARLPLGAGRHRRARRRHP